MTNRKASLVVLIVLLGSTVCWQHFLQAAEPSDRDPLGALEAHLFIRLIEAQSAAVIATKEAKDVDYVALNSYKRSLHETFFLYWLNAISEHGVKKPKRLLKNPRYGKIWIPCEIGLD